MEVAYVQYTVLINYTNVYSFSSNPRGKTLFWILVTQTIFKHGVTGVLWFVTLKISELNEPKYY